MQDSLLLELINSLNVSERRKAAKFLRSPYGNAKEDAERLFHAILGILRRGQVPSSRALYGELFPAEAYRPQPFSLLCSHLHRCLHRFLALEAFEGEANVFGPVLVRALRKKGLYRHAERSIKRYDQYEFSNAESALARYRMEEERFNLSARQGRTKKMNLQQNEDALNDALVAFKLRQACFTKSHETVFRTSYNIRLLRPILNYAKDSSIPAILVYRSCYIALYDDPTEENFITYREHLLQYGLEFPLEELRSLYFSALNYCIRRINENAVAYLKEAFDLYDRGIRTGLILENEKISRFTFNNYVGIGIRLGHVNSIQKFVEENAHLLEEKWRSLTVALNLARIHYQRKNYDKALTYLQQTDYEDLITNMTVKILQAKIFYDTMEFDLLDSHLSTMKRFIRRNKKMAYHHENWKNIHKYFHKLMRTNFHDKLEIESLIQSVEDTKILTEKEWVLQRLKKGLT